ncbi:hypothetical protein HPB49_026147 [Dermacentor silvarum]|nr:hypothetical protein HPB49_026147 [Dermacentor silvarum]
MAASFGLYFGNTNLCLAIHKDGNTEAVTNDSGDRVTPAIIAFSNGEKLKGKAAGIISSKGDNLAELVKKQCEADIDFGDEAEAIKKAYRECKPSRR